MQPVNKAVQGESNDNDVSGNEEQSAQGKILEFKGNCLNGKQQRYGILQWQ
jgi:hypothetical protein